MTERIYERDAYCREFSATVVACESAGDAYRLVLDRTAFFPEGGGQAADRGSIAGVPVTDVQRQGDTVYHTVSRPFAVGETVTGVLDWELRFDRMQCHAGEHIVAGVIHALFGYDNVGFHLGESVMTVDFSGSLSPEDVDEVERRANRAICENLPITVSFPTAAELEALEFRSKIEATEGVRLVTIGDVDRCACCAPHPARSGEIGLVKIVSHIPYKQGTRMEIIAGSRAVADYMALNAVNKRLMSALSAPRDGVEDAVRRQLELVQTLRSENQRLSRRLALSELVTVPVGDGVYAVTHGVSYDDLRACANAQLDKGCRRCLLFSAQEDGGYLYVVSGREDVRQTVSALNAALAGKGGGRDGYAQGKLAPASEDAVRAVAEQLLSE